MKKHLAVLMLLTSLSVLGQIPSYYNDVNLTLTGTNLKDELATKIISTHNTFLSYTPGVWNALKQTDLDPTDPTKVILIYGWNDSDSDITNDRTRGRDDNGGGSGVWNREHVYSKSLANPNLGTSGPGADAHNLRPCDAQRNSSRSNRKFASGSGTASYITAQGNWYPGDEWKGDVARMMMYMYLRYGNQSLPINIGVGTTTPTDPNMINLFLEWNAEDPVSDLEKQRNPVLEIEQGNRNPFIDNPALATQIWGGPQAEDLFNTGGGTDTQAPSNPSGLIASNTTSTTVDLAWTAATDNVAVTGYNIFSGTTQIGTTTTSSFNVTGLTAGTSYTFYVKAFDTAGNVSANSNGVSVTTTGGSGGSGTTTELIISEYVEGSSFNKAIEIANFTGSTVNLSEYSLRKTTNGDNSWGSTLNLSGQLANGEVYVVAHVNASTAIKNEADITISAGAMNFNGNDAVALFKNSSLIDLVGTPSSSSNFGKDVTLQRKSSVTSPNTSYVTSEWNSLSSDTISDLGTHTVDGSTTTPDTQAPTAPSGLTASNTTQTGVNLAWNAATDNTAVTGYDVYQGSTKVATVTTLNYSVTNLTASSSYSFSVRAIDAAGNTSSSSNAVSVTTLDIPDTQAPTTPSLTVSNITETTVSLTWNAATDNTAVTGYDVYQGSTKIATVTTLSYNVVNLTPDTTYSFTVRAFDAAGNVSIASNTASITTLPTTPVLTYCNSKGNNVNYEYIDNVVIGGISNSTSANAGYGDFTNLTGNLSFGSNTIVVSAGFTSSSYTENWAVWIDLNQNGTFESSEQLVTGSSSSSGNLSYSFNIPTTAKLGNTRMRVSMKWNGAPTACETFSYGEVEDYTVNIGTSSRSLDITSVDIDGELGDEDPIFDANVYPNPAINFINISLRDQRDSSYKIINTLGQIVKTGTIERNIDVSNLNNGMYIIEVSDGQKLLTKKFIKK
ncbi:endonuclease [uncultured Tenacibaculum sp.]|uniref:endonuclease n=1 Tax=uncultured Tenacibaculum sp. TaxID=174713 RepID=UPI0026227D9F|nr:endonuclease [uncultured Tenacibaculum sp.]